MRYPALSSALILLNTGSSGAFGAMAGDVHEVLKRMRQKADEHIDLAHCLLGPTDMIVHVHANDFETLLRVIDDKIMPLKAESHNYLSSTETLIVKRSLAREPLSDLHKEPTQLFAWVFGQTNTTDEDVVDGLMQMDGHIYYGAQVIGRYDVALLVKADNMDQLMTTIDGTLRKKNFLISTDTRMVLMSKHELSPPA